MSSEVSLEGQKTFISRRFEHSPVLISFQNSSQGPISQNLKKYFFGSVFFVQKVARTTKMLETRQRYLVSSIKEHVVSVHGTSQLASQLPETQNHRVSNTEAISNVVFKVELRYELPPIQPQFYCLQLHRYPCKAKPLSGCSAYFIQIEARYH